MSDVYKSNAIYFQNVMSNKRLLTHGYLREIECKFQSLHSIPAALKHMILKYFLFNEFTFDDSNPHWIMNDDKLSARLKAEHGTIKFGQFFKSTDNVIYTATLKMEEGRYGGSFGVGFITSKFNEWNPSRWNDNEEAWKECVTMYNNGYYRASNPFTELNPGYGSYSGPNWNYWNVEKDQIIIEINTLTMIGKVSKSRDKRVIQGVFQLNLPEDVGIILNGSTKWVTTMKGFKVINQTLSYFKK